MVNMEARLSLKQVDKIVQVRKALLKCQQSGLVKQSLRSNKGTINFKCVR